MSQKKSKFSQATIELAAQIVFEYPEWSSEHIGDMMATYAESGDRPPCSANELEDACNFVQRHKYTGLSFQQVVEELT